MKRVQSIPWHLTGWGLYFIYFSLRVILDNPYYGQILLVLSHTLISMIQFYVCYLFIFPLLLKKRKLFALMAALAAVLGGYIGLRFLIEEMAYQVLFNFSNYSTDTTLKFYIADNLYYGSIFIVISFIVWTLEETFYKEKENQNLRQEKTQAELAFLKSQINPHFLYNTLNYIYAQAYPVSERLSIAILKLSDLMRYMLQDNTDGKVSLQEEINYLNSYIEIYRLRFEKNFFVDFTMQGQINGQRIPMLMLIPFVENAFKHGIVNDPTSPIQIELFISKDLLQFRVKNKINNLQKDTISGIGLTNIQRRLDLLYPKTHQFHIKENTSFFEINLCLPTL